MTNKNKTFPKINGSFFLIDTHCHLDMDDYKTDFEAVLDRASSHGVKAVITIGIDLTSSQNAVNLAAKHSMIWATVGIHPHDAGNSDEKELKAIQALIDGGEKIVGYGEIGLDYVKRYSSPEVQRQLFQDQLSLAKANHLPVIIHDREAHDDILAILKANGPFESGGIMHCFSGDLEFAKKILDLGFLISIPGIVTFKNAKSLQDVAQKIPLEALILETDGPFLSPVPYRGKRNEPLYLLHTADQIAKLRGMSLEELARATTRNAEKLFNISFQKEFL